MTAASMIKVAEGLNRTPTVWAILDITVAVCPHIGSKIKGQRWVDAGREVLPKFRVVFEEFVEAVLIVLV